jgi:uncharacterized YccA/Bax inhibitor family protein
VVGLGIFTVALLGVEFRFLYAPTPLAIGISVVIVILGALNLTLRLDFIERSAAGARSSFDGTARLG